MSLESSANSRPFFLRVALTTIVVLVVIIGLMFFSYRYWAQGSVAFPDAALVRSHVNWTGFPSRVGLVSEFKTETAQGRVLRWYENRLGMSVWRPLRGSTCQGARSERNYSIIQLETLVIVCQDEVTVTRVIDFDLR